jgi:transcription elongation factor Elf1
MSDAVLLHWMEHGLTCPECGAVLIFGGRVEGIYDVACKGCPQRFYARVATTKIDLYRLPGPSWDGMPVIDP